MNAIDMIVRCAVGQQHALTINAPDECDSRGSEVPDAGFLAAPQGEGVIAGYYTLGTLPGDTETATVCADYY